MDHQQHQPAQQHTIRAAIEQAARQYPELRESRVTVDSDGVEISRTYPRENRTRPGTQIDADTYTSLHRTAAQLVREVAEDWAYIPAVCPVCPVALAGECSSCTARRLAGVPRTRGEVRDVSLGAEPGTRPPGCGEPGSGSRRHLETNPCGETALSTGGFCNLPAYVPELPEGWHWSKYTPCSAGSLDKNGDYHSISVEAVGIPGSPKGHVSVTGTVPADVVGIVLSHARGLGLRSQGDHPIKSGSAAPRIGRGVTTALAEPFVLLWVTWR